MCEYSKKNRNTKINSHKKTQVYLEFFLKEYPINNEPVCFYWGE